MEKDLVKKLSDFGFTVNQAKVYFSIVQCRSTCVRRISESTQLYRQDIYKILPKLEKMGLITKTIGRPFMIEAIPVESALVSLVATEREKVNKRISRLDTDLKELVNGLRKQEMGKTREEERRTIMLRTDSEIENMADLAFKNVRNELDLVTSLELIIQLIKVFSEPFQKLANRGVKIRIIIETLKNEDLVKRTLEKIKPDRGNFAAKLIHKSKSLPYQIFDHKELWISAQQLTEHGLPFVVWTNGRNMTKFYEENFKKAWNNRYAIRIYP